jgi:hypothetical protein
MNETWGRPFYQRKTIYNLSRWENESMMHPWLLRSSAINVMALTLERSEPSRGHWLGAVGIVSEYNLMKHHGF